MKAETEGLIIAAQDQSLFTRKYLKYIIKNKSNLIYRLCESETGPTDHVVSGDSILIIIENVR